MSSKKARRKKRQEQTQKSSKKGINPVTLFILGVGLALALTLVVGVMFRGDRGEPPRPGMVWSNQHGHWH
ncbi:MAG: hypothetical protein ACR2QM_02625 [Longimicrobiales bacterium]